MEQHALLFILVGPSGSGKNTLMREAIAKVTDLAQMPTGTTRAQRPTEVEGQQHVFLSEEEFDDLIQKGGFLEWQVVHGKRYGILKSILEEKIRSEKDYIADIEVLGASLLKQAYPNNTVLIFVIPSSLDVLEQRIRQRESISDEEVSIRLSRVKLEISLASMCDYIVINDDLEIAIEQMKGIIIAERSRRHLAKLRTSGALVIANEESRKWQEN